MSTYLFNNWFRLPTTILLMFHTALWSFLRWIHVITSPWNKTTSDTDIFLSAILAGRVKSVLFVSRETEFLSNTHYMFCGTSRWWRSLTSPRMYPIIRFCGIKLRGVYDFIPIRMQPKEENDRVMMHSKEHAHGPWFLLLRCDLVLIICTHII